MIPAEESELYRLHGELEAIVGTNVLQSMLEDSSKAKELAAKLFFYSDSTSSHDLSHLHFKKKPTAWGFLNTVRKFFGINRKQEYDFARNANTVTKAFSTVQSGNLKVEQLKSLMKVLGEHVASNRKPYDLHLLVRPGVTIDHALFPKNTQWNLVTHAQEVASIPSQARCVAVFPYSMKSLLQGDTRNRDLSFMTKVQGERDFTDLLAKLPKSDMLICFAPRDLSAETLQEWNALPAAERQAKLEQFSEYLKDLFLVGHEAISKAVIEKKFFVAGPAAEMDVAFYDYMKQPPKAKSSKIAELYHACMYKIKN